MREPRTGQERGKPSDLKLTVLVLLALLVVAAAMLLMARRDSRAMPSIANTGPSGLAAFAELLRRDGYVVVQNRDEYPKFERDDVVVEVELDQQPVSAIEMMSQGETSHTPETEIADHVARGGKLLELAGRSDFDAASRDGAAPVTVKSPALKREARVNHDAVASDADLLWTPRAESNYGLWSVEPGNRTFVTFRREGNGMEAGAKLLGASNRFIGRYQNAEIYLDVVRRLAPAGSRVVFAEASFGNAERKGLIGAIGGWAVAAQWQAVLIFLVVVYTLGKRFGLPETDPMVQRGTRDLVDAVAGVMGRGRKSGFALRSLVNDASEQARATLRLPSSMPTKEVWRRLPDGLSSALADALSLSVEDPKPRVAVKAAQRVLRELQAFERDHRDRSG